MSGGGGGGGGTTTYTYTCSLMMCLGEGPIRGVPTVWKGNSATGQDPASLGWTVLDGTLGQAPWSYLASFTQVSEQHTVPSQAPFTVTVNYTAAPFADGGVTSNVGETFTAVAAGSEAAGHYSVAAGTYTFAAIDGGRDVTIAYTSGNQQPPNQAMSYSGFACVAAANYDLGDSASLPNHNFEIQAHFSDSVPGQPDMDPSLWVVALWTNPQWGLAPAVPAVLVGDLSRYQSYALAAGLLLSVEYAQQQPCAQYVDDITQYTNSDLTTRDGALTIIPRGDEPLTGNGATYTPPPFTFALGDDDWLPNNAAVTSSGNSSGDPLILTDAQPENDVNQLTIEFLNRANAYVPEPVTARDLAGIQTYGLNDGGSRQAHLFADARAARTSATLLLKRGASRNTWQGTVGEHAVCIDDGDLGTINGGGHGLVDWPVRCTLVDEQSDGTLLLMFEDYLPGAATAGTHAVATPRGYQRDYNVAAGDAAPPIIFEPPVQITATGLEVWLGTCGGPDWAGAEVHVASDGVTYRKVGSVANPARLGVLTAPLAAGADPDTTDTVSVDLTTGRGQMGSGTQADADLGHTACWCDGEILSYQTATLTAQYRYTLGTYLRRGLWGTPAGAHAAGAAFLPLDESIFKLPYDKGQIGATLHIKLLSFNHWGGVGQTLDQVPAYTYTIGGPPRPVAPSGFAAQQKGDVVVFGWAPLPDYAVDLAYGPKGCTVGVTVDTSWAAMSPITEAAKGTEMTNAAIQPGDWTFGLRSRNTASAMLSAGMATVDLTVSNSQSVIAAPQMAPAWSGTLTGFRRHITGVLVPESAVAANALSNVQLFEQFVPRPVATSTYDTGAIGDGILDAVRVWGTVSAQLVGGQGNVATALALDSSADGITWSGTWTPWTGVGTVTAAYVRLRLIQDNGLGACVVTGLQPTIDVPLKSEVVVATVPAGGGPVTFAKAYHAPPGVSAGASGIGLTSASAVDVTRTGCTAHAWAGGSDVGGPVTLTIGPSP